MCYLQIAYCPCGAQLGSNHRHCHDEAGLGTFSHVWILASYFADIAANRCPKCLPNPRRRPRGNDDLSPYKTQCVSRTASACGCESIKQTPELLAERWDLKGFEVVLVAVSRSMDVCGEMGCMGNPIRQTDTLQKALRTTVKDVECVRTKRRVQLQNSLGLVRKE